MAKERMVTRTLTITTWEVMTVDITTATTGTARFDIVGEHTFDTALKAVKELYETETTKIVTITDLVLNDYLYGMPESDFIKMAKILPARNTTKVGEEND